MIKFKTLFRKSYGGAGASSSSSSATKKNHEKAKTLENALSSKDVISSKTSLGQYNTSKFENIDQFEVSKPDINIDKTKNFTLFRENNKISPITEIMNTVQPFYNNAASEIRVDYENVKRQLESILSEKNNIELTLQELVQSHGELSSIRKEIENLKVQRDEIQNSILLRINNCKDLTDDEANDKIIKNKKWPNSAPASIAPQTESSSELLDAPEWDKNSSSSEVSVACLQDRIMQMEETHYSTSEELQATLQELADLQTQLLELQNDNERLAEEKGVLLESLCRQTEKLDDARNKVDTLQDLLLDSNKSENSFSEREQKLMLLLKDGQQDREELLSKQKELTNKFEDLNHGIEKQKQESNNFLERILILESTIEVAKAERKHLENELSASREENSCKLIEIKRLETLLENARIKIEEVEQNRSKETNKNDINSLIDTLRKEKDHLEIKVASLQEQISKNKCEAAKLKEQLQQNEDEYRITLNKSKSATYDLESNCQKHKEECERLKNEIHALREKNIELEIQCQCQSEDKKQLKCVVLQTQQNLAESDRLQNELKQSLDEEKELRLRDQAEWDQFQSDLLMTVRVANDLKTEAQAELERLVLENKQLREQIKLLESKIQTLTKVGNTSPPLLHRTLSNNETLLTTWSQEMNRRNNAAKKLSVKTLIESIENAHKHVKTGNGCVRSHSASSLNTMANQFSGSSSPSTKESYDMQLPVKNYDEHLSSSDSFISGLEFARKSGVNDSNEKKDPLQALVKKNGGSKRNALLKWCQNKVAGYANVDITNFSSSWNDGMALCALLHSYIPEKVPYETLNPDEKKRNFTVAFEAAESVGIRTCLNIIDMIQEDRPDWNQVMAYVTAIFRHFEPLN